MNNKYYDAIHQVQQLQQQETRQDKTEHNSFFFFFPPLLLLLLLSFSFPSPAKCYRFAVRPKIQNDRRVTQADKYANMTEARRENSGVFSPSLYPHVSKT